MCARAVLLLPPLLLSLLALLGILLMAVPSRELRTPPGLMYGVVVDAGSSHTSIYVYKWPADKQNGTGIVTQHSECHVDKGISSYVGVPGGAAKSLTPCLDRILTEIPTELHYHTPLCLGATAGMRLLQELNSTHSQRILKEVELKLRSYPLDFKEAVILSGQREGAYGWVTVNYLLENFIKYGMVGRWMNPGRASVGALDLGGASTQITFEASEEVQEKEHLMELQLYGHSYTLYTHSFLCYGQEQVLGRLLAHLITTQGVDRGPIVHPCFPRLYNTTVTLGADVFDSPCTKDERPVRFDPLTKVRVVGTGDAQLCSESLRTLFSFLHCPHAKCSFNGVYQPRVTGRFMAFSAFYYSHRFLSRLTNVEVTSPDNMREATRLVCNMTLTELREKTKEKDKHLTSVCAVANFIHLLLIDGYQFDQNSFGSITFGKEAGGVSVGWALGYMLTLSHLVPAHSLGLIKALPPGNWAVALAIFTFILLYALIHLLLIFWNTGTAQDVV